MTSADRSALPDRLWRVAAATHAARDAIGAAPSRSTLWPGMRAFLVWAADAGFDGIDLSDSVVPFDQPGVGDLRELAKGVSEHGLRLGGLNLLRCSLADADHADENADRARRAIEACAALDAGVVSISLALPRAIDDCNLYRGMDHSRGSSRLATPADFEGTAERLRLLCTDAREANVKLSIEVHHASIADNGAATLHLHSLVSEPDVVGVNPDLVNSYWAYATPEEDWRDQLTWLAPLANIWHIKNVRRVVIEPGRRAEYLGTSLGDGDIDYRSASAVMRDAGFCGWVSIERGGTGDALHLMAESLAYLQNLMNDLASGDNRHALQG